MPSHNRTDQLELLIAGSLPFEGQRWYHHVLLVLGGFAVWTGAYATMMYVNGWVHLAGVDSPEALAARRTAARWALAVMVGYLMLFWLRGYGGFALSWMLYPALISGMIPDWIYALGGTMEGRPVTTVSLTSNMFVFSYEVVWIIFPAGIIAGIFFGLVTGYWITDDEKKDKKAARFWSQLPDRQIRVFTKPSKYENPGPRTQAVLREAGAAPEDVLEEMETDPRDEPLSDDATLRELVPAALLLFAIVVAQMPVLLVLLLILAVPAGGFYLFLWLLPGTKIARRKDREQ